ncbi:helix-turn-helix domain-containing protein [Streptomyces sp. NBC_00996]|uniref:MmyB family transcriptional regulator n=1 Tax=Streptomyces sp. NBC_00996 TaxID=2903710 RepID=UPI00386AC87A
MDHRSDNRTEIRDFLASRRAKITPEQAGLPTSGRRRLPGLRREEVAVLAGVSTEWYTRLEKGHISGVSDDVLDAVARALQLDEDERTYLFDLARAARPANRTSSRRKDVAVPPRIQWLLDSMTMSSAFVRNGRQDIVASNPLARALHAPVFDSNTIDKRGRPNIARYIFLDPGAHHFFVDWDAAAVATAALLRAEAGREPHDRALRDLIGELSTLSPEFRSQWAAHDVRIRHDGIKRLQHPEVGHLELSYQSLDLPMSNRAVPDLTLYTNRAAPPKTGSSSSPAWQPPSPRRQSPPTSRANVPGRDAGPVSAPAARVAWRRSETRCSPHRVRRGDRVPDSRPSVHIVISRLRPEASREAFLDVTRRMVDWLRLQPGFVGYELYEAKENWADRLEWESTVHAEQGLRAFLGTDIYAEMIGYVEDDYHGIIGRSVPL